MHAIVNGRGIWGVCFFPWVWMIGFDLGAPFAFHSSEKTGDGVVGYSSRPSIRNVSAGLGLRNASIEERQEGESSPTHRKYN